MLAGRMRLYAQMADQVKKMENLSIPAKLHTPLLERERPKTIATGITYPGSAMILRIPFFGASQEI